MAVSHICLSCGLDLARVRAVTEPHYGLPLVVCPECSVATVRRKEAVTAAWRRTLRTAAAIRAMVLRLAAGAVLMGASVGIVFFLELEAESDRGFIMEVPGALLTGNSRWTSDEDWPLAVVFFTVWALVQTGVGILLSGGLAHWRPRALPWVVWAAVLVLMLSLNPATYPLRAAMAWALRDPVFYHGPGLGDWAGRIAVGLIAMAAAPIGIPAGWGLVWLSRLAGRFKFRARRRLRRRERGFGG